LFILLNKTLLSRTHCVYKYERYIIEKYTVHNVDYISKMRCIIMCIPKKKIGCCSKLDSNSGENFSQNFYIILYNFLTFFYMNWNISQKIYIFSQNFLYALIMKQ